MEDIYDLDHSIDSLPCSDEAAANFSHTPGFNSHVEIFQLEEFQAKNRESRRMENSVYRSEISDLVKAQIANHPRYPRLVAAYIDCRKVGAPPEMASFLEEIGRKSRLLRGSGEIGVDPELDDFMDSYCEILSRYKEELSKPFDEARIFLSKIETQLSDLCSVTTSSTTTTTTGNEQSDEAAGSSEEELSYGDVEGSDVSPCLGDQELKAMLMRKYSGYLSSLRKEFLKRRKNGKLPRDARLMLLNWWNTHSRWPYPTDEEKAKLAEATGLEQKQINNWFINQRKRHWKPSEEMRGALMEAVSGAKVN